MTIYNAFWELIWPDMILHNLLMEGDEESSRGIIFGGIYVDYKLKNIYKVSGPFILQEKVQVWSSNKI